MPCKGFTLIEIVITLLISATLMLFAIPGFQQLIQQSTINDATHRLFSQLQLAKTTAIAQGKNVILCATDTGDRCNKNWSNGTMVFIDENKNDQFDTQIDSIINLNQVTPRNPPKNDSTTNNNQEKPTVTIQWRSFRGNKPIRFIPMGITWHFNGTFTLCLNRKPQVAKSIFVAKSGRIETSRDRNNDGIDEDRNGKPVNCN